MYDVLAATTVSRLLQFRVSSTCSALQLCCLFISLECHFVRSV